MSYRCEKCNAAKTTSGAALKVVTEVRHVRYNKMFERFDRREKAKVMQFDEAFDGQEIVHEQKLCEACYELLKDSDPKVSPKNKFVDFIGTKKQEPRDDDSDPKKAPDFRGLKEKFNGQRSH